MSHSYNCNINKYIYTTVLGTMDKFKKIKMNKERDIYSRIHGLTYIVCHNASIPM